MRHARRITYMVSVLAFYLLLPSLPLYAQADIRQTVQSFLQAWYVDRKGPEELKSYIARDNGFNLTQTAPSPNAPVTAARADPVNQLFTGAFTQAPIGSEAVRLKSLSEAIEYSPAKKPPTMRRKTTSGNCMTSLELAICKPDQLPKGTVLPAAKPSGNDPIANYLWHLSQAYKNKLYIVLYSTKGAGLLRETAILYWIQEGDSWKLAAFKGTNW